MTAFSILNRRLHGHISKAHPSADIRYIREEAINQLQKDSKVISSTPTPSR